MQRGTEGGDRDRQKVLTYRQVDARVYVEHVGTQFMTKHVNSIFFLHFIFSITP